MAVQAAAILRGIALMAAGGGGGGGGGDGGDGGTGGILGTVKKVAGYADQANSAMDRLRFNFSKLNLPVNFVQGGMDLALTIEQLNISLGKTTGYTSHLSKDFIELTRASSHLGMSFEEGQKIVGALATDFRKFPAYSQAVRHALAKVAGQLNSLGLDSRVTAKSLDIFTSSLQRTPDAAQASIEALHRLAQQVGRSTADVIQEFTIFSPKLLKYGDTTERVFEKLAQSARGYHLDIAEAIQIADQFDTFEGAAEKVGKLNAVFAKYNLNLNDAVLRELDEADRIEYLGDRFRQAGVDIQNMDHRLRQVLATQLTGGDQDLLGRMLGPKEEYEAYQKQQESLAETSAKFTGSIAKLQGAAQKFLIDSGWIEYGTRLLNGLSTAMDHLKPDASAWEYFKAIFSIFTHVKTKPLTDFTTGALGGKGGSGALADALKSRPMINVEAQTKVPKKPKKADDLYIPGATKGRRYITGPQGTFSLNNRDSILAGTDLTKGGVTAADIQKAVQAGVSAAMRQGSSKPVEVTLDGRVLGRALMDEVGKVMSPIAPR